MYFLSKQRFLHILVWHIFNVISKQGVIILINELLEDLHLFYHAYQMKISV